MSAFSVVDAGPARPWNRLGAWLRGGASGSDPGRGRLPQPDDYQLDALVAQRDRACLYRATEKATGRAVAMKLVRLGEGPEADRPLWRARFLSESASASRLDHPDIVHVYAGGVQSLMPPPDIIGNAGPTLTGWLAMEWATGADLTRYTRIARLLPEPLVFALVGRIALALDHAHAAGIVHRDIKPANLMFDPASGSLKITDFGSARIADAAATRSGLIIGSPAYMAPEQLAGADATPQSDFYALGVLLHEMLCGHRPFEADSMGELLARIAHAPIPRVSIGRPALPPLVDDILQRLLAKDPAKRHASGRQLANDLRMAQSACRALRRANGIAGDRLRPESEAQS